MTHHTDAEQLHQLLELVLTELDRKAIPIAYMQEIDRKGKAFIEQAARRAPSMPDQSIIEAVDGWFARNTALGGCSDKDVAELAAIFAAAPQPPEAAPVELPEPSAWMLGCQTMGGDVGWKLSWSKSGAGVCHRLSGEEFEHPLYTEQQVRELLAANGIQEQST